MSPLFKIALALWVVATLLVAAAARAQTTTNVLVSWTMPVLDSMGNQIPTTNSNGTTNAITNSYVYEGPNSQDMQQVAKVAAPGTSYSMSLASGHYCFSVIVQNAIGSSPFAAAVCANVTATGVTVISMPAAPTGFGAK